MREFVENSAKRTDGEEDPDGMHYSHHNWKGRVLPTTPAAAAATSGWVASAAVTTPAAAAASAVADGPATAVVPARKFRRLAKTGHQIDLEADPMDTCDVCKAHDCLSECRHEPQCWKLMCRGCNKRHEHAEGEPCPSCMNWVDDLDVDPADPKCPACGSYDAQDQLGDHLG